MITFETNRLIAKTEMVVSDGRMIEKPNLKASKVDLLGKKPTTGFESAFRFFLKDTGEEVCKIGITHHRERYEIECRTVDKFQNQGFMSEALTSLIEWISMNTKEETLWALPISRTSAHIIVDKCGFEFFEPSADGDGLNWYIYHLR